VSGAPSTLTADAAAAAGTPGGLTEALAEVLTAVADRAGATDRAETDVRPALAELGAAGLLTLGAPGYGGTLADQAEVLRSLSRVCMSTAFSAWAQRLAIEYLAGFGTDTLRRDVLPELAAGARPAATAMATAFQDALGLRELGVTARPEADGVVLDGSVPWASNLFDGAVVVLPARTEDGRRLIVAVRTDTPGLTLPPYPALLALDATASTSLRLDGVRIPADRVLTDRFLDFLTTVRTPFLLLQSAFCLGIADASLASAAGRFEGAAQVLEADHDDLVGRRDRLSADHARLLARGGHADASTVRLRLEAGRLGVDATRHEVTVRGGAGYVAGGATARRFREAAFLPIQSPTEAQLRWELSRSE
jgi:alkylation response protein AidB-like acyl-CoA dehydrogenase